MPASAATRGERPATRLASVAPAKVSPAPVASSTFRGRDGKVENLAARLDVDAVGAAGLEEDLAGRRRTAPPRLQPSALTGVAEDDLGPRRQPRHEFGRKAGRVVLGDPGQAGALEVEQAGGDFRRAGGDHEPLGLCGETYLRLGQRRRPWPQQAAIGPVGVVDQQAPRRRRVRHDRDAFVRDTGRPIGLTIRVVADPGQRRGGDARLRQGRAGVQRRAAGAGPGGFAHQPRAASGEDALDLDHVVDRREARDHYPHHPPTSFQRLD